MSTGKAASVCLNRFHFPHVHQKYIYTKIKLKIMIIVYVEFLQMNPKGWDKASVIMMMIYVKITMCSTGCRSWGVR